MIVKLPVAVEQVGCVTALNIGCAGVTGCGLIVALVAIEIHPDEFFAVTL